MGVGVANVAVGVRIAGVEIGVAVADVGAAVGVRAGVGLGVAPRPQAATSNPLASTAARNHGRIRILGPPSLSIKFGVLFPVTPEGPLGSVLQDHPKFCQALP